MLRTTCPITFLLSAPSLTNARTVAGFEFPEVIPASSHNEEMLLNGAAVRTMYFLVDAYVGLLYVGNPGSEPQQLINQNTSKRLVYHILVNRVSGRRIATAMYESLQLNLSKEEVKAMDDRLQQLVTLFDAKMVRGEVGYVEYVPAEESSRVVINGEIKGTIPGKDLFDALMKIWISEHPVSARFKEEILQQKEESNNHASAE